MRPWWRHARWASLAALLLTGWMAQAGGPLVVGGPGFGIDGQAFTWDTAAMPIRYRVDGGPLSRTPAGATVINNASGLARVQSMFQAWQSVPTAAISFTYGGPIQSTGAFVDGDVSTVVEFNAVMASCDSGAQNPIMFDADGSIVRGLGLDPDIIGFAGPCKLDKTSGHIASGFALLNGQFQDGIDQGTNFELTANQFDEAITHELGHLVGLDHSQINVSVLWQLGGCTPDDLAGLPLMFPLAFCPARADAGLPILAPDDMAWLSRLYPGATYAANYGLITGVIRFSDGITHAQGVNVIARQVDDPSTPVNESRRVAVSVVSGFRFTGNPGQSLTGDNVKGNQSGSRDPVLIGYYEIPVPPGTYTVEVESIQPGFTGGSSVGPLDPPIVMPGATPEFWNHGESAFDDPAAKDAIQVAPGQTVPNIDVILNRTPPRFDQFEDSGELAPQAPPTTLWAWIEEPKRWLR